MAEESRQSVSFWIFGVAGLIVLVMRDYKY